MKSSALFSISVLVIASLCISFSLGQEENETGTPFGIIIFASNMDGDYELYAVQTDAGNLIQLTDNDYDDLYPSWRSDGGEILFSSNESGTFDIYRMPLDGSEESLVHASDGDDISARYAPDGSSIVFTSNVDGDNEIFITDPSGSEVTQLSFNDIDDSNPMISPAGDQIVFASERDGNRQIFLMNLDGGDVTKLVPRLSREPAWSPDGTQVIYSCHRERTLQSGTWDLCAVTVEDGRRSRIVETGSDDRGPSLSPDGTHLVLSTNRDGSDREIFIYNLEGRILLQLTDDSTQDIQPAWSPSVETVEIGEIILTDTRVDEVVDVSTIDLPNCEGTSELTISREFSYETRRSTSQRSERSFNFSPRLAVRQSLFRFSTRFNLIRARISNSLAIEESEILTETIEVELKAAPGTSVSYEVQWVEVSNVVLVEFIQGDNRFFEEYLVTSSLKPNVLDPVRNECE